MGKEKAKEKKTVADLMPGLPLVTAEEIALDKIDESGANLRNEKDYDLADLTASVKKDGILVPLLLRPAVKAGRYEIVAGHRRLRAAKAAGLKAVPAVIRMMTDEEARRAQIIENLQRKDLHPLDEASGFNQLIKSRSIYFIEEDFNIGKLAAEIGKSKIYVVQRLKLLNLTDEIKKLFRAGKILLGHALLLCRLNPEEQNQALKDCYGLRGGEFAVKSLAMWIDRNCCLKLADAPFDTKKCRECDKRTGTAPTLFPDIKSGETCVSPSCYQAKCDAMIQSKIAKARNEGMELVRVCGGHYSEKKLLDAGDYVKLGKKDGCDFAEQAVIAEGRGFGDVISVCRNKKCKKHRKDLEYSGETPEQKRASRKRQLAKEKKVKEAREKRLKDALAKVKWPLSEKHLGALLALAFENAGSLLYGTVAKRHGLEVKKVKCSYGSDRFDYESALKKASREMSQTDKAKLIFELLIDTGYDSLREGIGKL